MSFFLIDVFVPGQLTNFCFIDFSGVAILFRVIAQKANNSVGTDKPPLPATHATVVVVSKARG